nr:hypothetical protein [Bacillus subtilis]
MKMGRNGFGKRGAWGVKLERMGGGSGGLMGMMGKMGEGGKRINNRMGNSLMVEKENCD